MTLFITSGTSSHSQKYFLALAMEKLNLAPTTNCPTTPSATKCGHTELHLDLPNTPQNALGAD